LILWYVQPFAGAAKSSEVLAGVTVAVPTTCVGHGIDRVARYRDAVRALIEGKFSIHAVRQEEKEGKPKVTTRDIHVARA